MAEFNMETAVADIGSALDLGGSDDGASSGLSDSAGDNPAGDLDDASDTGGDLGDDAAGRDSAGKGPSKEAGALDAAPGTEGEAKPGAFVAPQTWTPAAAEKLAAADPLIQQEVAKRESDMFRGLEMYRQDATLGKTFSSIMQPYMPLLEHFKVDPGQLIPNLLEAHKSLALGTPEQKMAIFRQLATDYGVPLDQAAAEAPYVDPEVARLQRENQTLQSERQRERQQAENNARQTAAQVLDAFIADPKNIYFKEVGDDIAQLLQGGVCKTLQEAYEKAVWANPATRAKEQARLQTEKAAKDRTEAETRAAAARRSTAANVRGSAKNAGGTAALGSMDDTITSQLKAIRARS